MHEKNVADPSSSPGGPRRQAGGRPHQRGGGLQGVVLALAAEVAGGPPSQLGIHEEQQSVSRLEIAAAPGPQEPADRSRRRRMV